MKNVVAIPDALIEQLFDSSPSDALLTVAEVVFSEDNAESIVKQKAIRWAEREIASNIWKWRHGYIASDQVEPTALDQLRFLAQHSEYWARLYVVKIIQQHPEFGSEELIRKLRSDSHPLVLQAAREIIER